MIHPAILLSVTKDQSNIYFSWVYQVRIHLRLFVSIWAHFENPVLAVNVYLDIFGQLRRQETWNADAQVHIHTISNLLCSPLDNLEFCFVRSRQLLAQNWVLSDRKLLNYLFRVNTVWVLNINPVHVNSRHMNIFRWNLAVFDQFLNLGYNHFSRSRHIRIEVPRCFCKI